MKTITIGRIGCDIIISDSSISRKHATISLINGQYVFNDISKNGSTINGKVYQNEKVVIAPGTPIYLANKIELPWAQILLMLPNAPVRINNQHYRANEEQTTYEALPPIKDEAISAGWGIASFLFPIIGFILYFIWKDTSNYKAKQALNIALISFGISFLIGFFSTF